MITISSWTCSEILESRTAENMTAKHRRPSGVNTPDYVWDPTHRNRPKGGGWHRTSKGWSKIQKTKLAPISFNDDDDEERPVPDRNRTTIPRTKLAPISFDDDEEERPAAPVKHKTKLAPISFDDEKEPVPTKTIPKMKLAPISFDDDDEEPGDMDETSSTDGAASSNQVPSQVPEGREFLRPRSHSTIMGWYDDIETECDALMYRIGDVIGRLVDSIDASGGDIVPDVDSELAKVEAEIASRTEAFEKNRNEQSSLRAEIRSTESKWKSKLDEMSSFQNKAEKYMEEKDSLKNCIPGTRAYKEQKERLKAFKQSYDRHRQCVVEADELYSALQELRNSLDRAEEYGMRFKKIPGVQDDELHYINVSLKNYRDKLLSLKENLDDVTAVGCEENRQRFIDTFSDRKNRDTFAAKVYNIIQNVVNGAFTNPDEFSDDQKNEFLEYIFKPTEDRETEWRRFNPFAILATNSDYISDTDDGRVFDMSDVPSLDLFRVFCNYAGGHLWTSSHLALDRMKNKRETFIRENQKSDEDDDDYSLYDNGAKDTAPLDEKRDWYQNNNSRIINQETQDYSAGLKQQLDDEMDAMADTVSESVRNQLSPKSYFNRITPNAARSELKSALQKVLNSVFYELVQGRPIEGRMKNLVKHALGGNNNSEEFEIIYKVMYATLQLHIMQKMKESYLNTATEEMRDSDPKTLYIVQKMDRKIDNAKQGIEDYSKVVLAERLHRNARAVVESVESASQAVDDRVDFLLDGRRLPDGSGKWNR